MFYDTNYYIHRTVMLSFHNQLVVHKRQIGILNRCQGRIQDFHGGGGPSYMCHG